MKSLEYRTPPASVFSAARKFSLFMEIFIILLFLARNENDEARIQNKSHRNVKQRQLCCLITIYKPWNRSFSAHSWCNCVLESVYKSENRSSSSTLRDERTARAIEHGVLTFAAHLVCR